ncbi:MAG: HEAT repeat domain-containing protein [Planctomycetes bacterium]|nr:HEAT repeat domain-containing protein [Planctomycetota bacterium]
MDKKFLLFVVVVVAAVGTFVYTRTGSQPSAGGDRTSRVLDDLEAKMADLEKKAGGEPRPSPEDREQAVVPDKADAGGGGGQEGAAARATPAPTAEAPNALAEQLASIEKKVEEIAEGREASIKELAAQYADANSTVRKRAIKALGKMRDPQAIEVVRRAVRDPAPDVRKAAIEALGSLRLKEAIPDIGEALRSDPDHEVRRVATEALGEIGDLAAVPYLRNGLADVHHGVREHAAEAVGTIGDPDPFNELLPLLDDSDADVRENAAKALGQIGDRRAIPHLQRKMDDPGEQIGVKVDSAKALRLLGDQSAAKATIERARGDLESDDVEAQQEAIKALGELEDPEAMPVLRELEARKDLDPALQKTLEKAIKRLENAK